MGGTSHLWYADVSVEMVKHAKEAMVTSQIQSIAIAVSLNEIECFLLLGSVDS